MVNAPPETLRALTPADAALAVCVIHAAFSAQDFKTDPPSGALRETAESVAEALQQRGGFAAEANGRIVALVLFKPQGEALVIRRLSVIPERRGRGLGRMLVRACEEEARRLGLTRLEANVRLALENNRRFFAALGFEEMSTGAHPGYDEPTFAVATLSVSA